ncbi:hypothetical protein K2173_021585 [Erythroxylum novogranatense]|uniref:ENTH domain-containing protein n=1 Tax=Erythroxylum novogranatense TaxID=1862640 RepID=A0AAV8TNA9_9ROSI|nr:hypothetical protein K2173_021585 [Erythroxylum novogranatense]
MGTFLLNEMKKQARSFLQDKYRTARLALTDVTRAEMLAEEATNNDPWGPDAKTMTMIAEASFEVEDYWRVVDVLHKRFENVDWKQWRQSYKSLILLEFLLTHGPEDFAEEFQCDSDIIEELGSFKYVDEKGFNWGANMQKRSDNILVLLEGGEALRTARLKALKITKEIHGFGNSVLGSPSSSSFRSFSSSEETGELNTPEQLSLTREGHLEEHGNNSPRLTNKTHQTSLTSNTKLEESHLWSQGPKIQEAGSLLQNGEEKEKEDGFVAGICSKLSGNTPTKKCYGENVGFRGFSNVGKLIKKKYDRQFSMGY